MSDRLAALKGHSAVRFVGVGVLSYLIDVGALVGLHSGLGVPLVAATVTAYAVGFLVNFGLNRSFSFAADGPVGPQAFRYAILVAVNLGLTIAIVDGLTQVWSYYVGSKTIASVLNSSMNYCAYRFWIFRDRDAVRPAVSAASSGPPPSGAPAGASVGGRVGTRTEDLA